MYYRLGFKGRFVWKLSVFVLWIASTFTWMALLGSLTMSASSNHPAASYSAGINPAVGDVGMLLMSLIIFFVIPIANTALIMKLSHWLKGTPPHEPRKHLPSPSRPLRQLPKPSPRALPRGHSDAE